MYCIINCVMLVAKSYGSLEWNQLDDIFTRLWRVKTDYYNAGNRV